MTVRKLESVLISLGSNIEPAVNLPLATRLLGEHLEILGASAIFESPPYQAPQSPSFLNAAVEVLSHLEPLDLKQEILRPLEARMGRQRTDDRNAPRPIDLDISLFGDRVFDDEESGLVIPDPEILTRFHVACPLADLAPLRLHPTEGLTLAVIARRLCENSAIQRLHWPELLCD